jgi:Zn-dependent metalloprotease
MFLLVLLMQVALLSCKDKFVANSDNLCLQNVAKNPKENLLPVDTINTIKTLFDFNQMNGSNFVFYEYNQDDHGIYHANAYQFINGVRVFTNNVAFHFRQDKTFIFSSGVMVSKIDLNSKPSLSERRAASLFARAVRADTFTGINKDELLEGCLDVEFGYYDLNASSGSTVMNFVKAWKVTPKGKNYPIAYVNDKNDSIIYYFNGMMQEM